MNYAKAIEITKALQESTEGELNSALAFLRTVIAQRGVRISVYERGRCENILMELDRRSKATPPAVPSHPIELFRELAKLFLSTEGSPLRIANVEFWIDAAGPWADVLSFSVPASNWDARAMGESVAQLARCYPEVTRIVARFADPVRIPPAEAPPAVPSVRTVDAIRFLGTLTRHFDIYALAGDRNARNRQALMLAITGDKLPIAKCGVNALTKAFYTACNITGDCIAAREDVFADYCKAVLSGSGPSAVTLLV